MPVTDSIDYFENPESIEKMRGEYQQWRDSQPEYIAKEMSNGEIVKFIRDMPLPVIQQIFKTDFHVKDLCVRKINGKLYKRMKNPKSIFFNGEIIPWKE